MKVKKCESCEYYERRRWSHRYEPSRYHAIGMSHGYGYCLKHQRRCSQITKCEDERKES